MDSHQKENIIQSENKLEKLSDLVTQVTKLGHRIKFLRAYVRKAYTNHSRTSNLHSIFTTKLALPTFKTIEPYFKFFNEGDINIESPFWIELSNKTNISINTCYSLWINNTVNGYIHPWPKNASHPLMPKNKDDWIERGLKMQQPPFILFQNHASHLVSIQKSKWTIEEDNLLATAVKDCGKGKWSKVANIVRTKNPKQCMHRFRNKLESSKRGKWGSDEDNRLLNAVAEFGTKRWCKISEAVLTRNDAQCRERYLNVLDPEVSKNKWMQEEDLELMKLVEKHGEGNWSKIAGDIGGRTDAQCRRRYLQLSKFQ